MGRNGAAAHTARPQNSSIAQRLREEIVSCDAMFRSLYKLPPYNPDEVISRNGPDIYERMMGDAQIRASINTKRYALLARPWQVFPAVRDHQHPEFCEACQTRDFVEDALRNLKGPDGTPRDFRNSLFEMMSAYYRGFSLAEMIWRVEERGRWAGKYTLGALKFKNPKQIGFELDEYLNVKAITSYVAGSGIITVPRDRCLLYIYNQHDELPYGDSDLRSVYKHWYSKKVIIEFWNLRLQRFGIPFAYVVAPNAGEGAKGSLLQALHDFQQESSAVFPPNARPELLETKGDGAEPFVSALDWHNQQITIGILLQTLTSGEGRRTGSMALGRVHFDILLFALECMKQDIEATVNAQIVRPLVDNNFDHGLYPLFSLGNVNEKDLVRLAQAMNVLLTHSVVDAKEPILREMFNLPPMGE